jgi:hypothetical protein
MRKSHKKALYSIPGWEEFVSEDLRKYRSFEEAREFARNLKLDGAWKKWCKSGNRPDDIPYHPELIYKDSGWVGMGDFLGTGYRSFEEARKLAHTLKLNIREDWEKWCQSDERPDDIPYHPERAYKNSGWIGIGDFLGTGNIANKDREFRSFEEAREFVRNLKLSRYSNVWSKWSKSNERPDDIPVSPDRTYKDCGWVSWGDFLGTEYVHKKNFLPFEEAREFVINLNLNGVKAWNEWCKSGEKPDNIPRNPARTYKDSGWIGMGDWLGTGNIANKNKTYRSFEEAREFARNLKLNGHAAWNEWCKSGEKPNDMPQSSHVIYKDCGWVSWGDFLGTGNTKDYNFRSFEEARKFARNLKLNGQADWFKWCKSGKKPDDIPSTPSRTYKDSGWISNGDWLGTS